MEPYIWVIGTLIFIAVLSIRDQRKWKCPAPGCDFEASPDDERAATAHGNAHAKHKPVLK
jgi:hypothetical protein